MIELAVGNESCRVTHQNGRVAIEAIYYSLVCLLRSSEMFVSALGTRLARSLACSSHVMSTVLADMT
jgi:hypothetical protein